MHARPAAGFTLMELMVTLALVAVMIGLAAPNMRQFTLNNRLTSSANDLLHAISVARSEALKREAIGAGVSTQVTLCASNAPDALAPVCSGGEFTGWLVFFDPNADGHFNASDATEVLVARGSAHSDVVVANDGAGRVCFDRSGFSLPNCGGAARTVSVALCDGRFSPADASTASAGRALLLTATGRARITREFNEVKTALTVAVGDCTP